MFDENAFGFWISYFDIEDDEYGLEREDFVERFLEFRRLVRVYLESHPLGDRARATDLGHAVYVEIAEGDETTNPIAWLRELRSVLQTNGFRTVGVLSHGSRWVAEEGRSDPERQDAGKVAVWTLSNPSEPLRRAGFAEAASRVDDEAGTGWGPGLYLDTEAVEALDKKPKNEPTVLIASGAGFYRAGQ